MPTKKKKARKTTGTRKLTVYATAPRSLVHAKKKPYGHKIRGDKTKTAVHVVAHARTTKGVIVHKLTHKTKPKIKKPLPAGLQRWKQITRQITGTNEVVTEARNPVAYRQAKAMMDGYNISPEENAQYKFIDDDEPSQKIIISGTPTIRRRAKPAVRKAVVHLSSAPSMKMVSEDYPVKIKRTYQPVYDDGMRQTNIEEFTGGRRRRRR